MKLLQAQEEMNNKTGAKDGLLQELRELCKQYDLRRCIRGPRHGEESDQFDCDERVVVGDYEVVQIFSLKTNWR